MWVNRMSLKRWLDNGWLRPQTTGREEVRTRVEYDHVGGASEDDAKELFAFTRALREDVLSWLGAKHPEYFPT